MMPARKYSDELLEQAAEMRERGLSYAQIGRDLGMSIGAVSWHCLRLGADSPNTRSNTQAPASPMVMARGNHVVRRFSEDEDRRLLELESQGLRICEIARLMNRKPNSLRGRLMTLARIDERREQSA